MTYSVIRLLCETLFISKQSSLITGNCWDQKSTVILYLMGVSSLAVFVFFIKFALLFVSSNCREKETNASPWPYPQSYLSSVTYYSLDPNTFQFILKETKLKDCDILKHALKRYEKLMFLNDCSLLGKHKKSAADNRMKYTVNDPNYLGELKNLTIQIRRKCESMPHPNMDEMYTLRVNSPDFPDQAILFANNVWGALRGLESLSQLIYSSDKFYINTTFILDYPRFSHRGLLLDTSRHYISTEKLLENLDAMAYNKLNVFHWHIVDDQSFPYVSRKFPDLSEKGAFLPTHVYSPKDISAVIEYARLRGIRVMVEFDTPGHTLSWGKGQPNLLTQCYISNHTKIGDFGPIDPTISSNYDFLQKFFLEISQTFPDQYLHLGGDEVNFDCWKSNPKITEFMKSMGFGTDYSKLEEYYMQKVVRMIDGLNKSSLVWQEVYDNGVELSKDTIVHVWKGDTPTDYHYELSKITNAGHRAILSSPWYLSNIQFGADWKTYYQADPQAFAGSPEQKELIIGGEVCMWGEYIDGTNLISRTWPRASPVAERLWSSADIRNIKNAIPRLEKIRCLMLQRGIRVEPVNGPGTFCTCDYAV